MSLLLYVKNSLKRVLPEKVLLLLHAIKKIFFRIAGALQIIRSPIDSFYVHKLRKLLASGDVVIVPVGFRCFTKEILYRRLGISQPSLPFDVGFFPPVSVANLLRNKKLDLSFDDPLSHAVCIKTENHVDEKYGLGIRFETTTYDQIDSIVKDRTQDDINRYLDSTFGYYTLDKKNNFVLAHYNWHRFADKKQSNGISDPKLNLRFINELMNRRLQRLFDMCERAKIIFFVYDETQGYRYMAVDDSYYDLIDLDPIKLEAESQFKAKTVVMKLKDVATARQMLEVVEERLVKPL